ncbi:MAG: adenylate/guanylate cyclase domain-containing protein [Rhodocyclaceae bacterium]|nr:adenylate/guanylate cyclase domain-containing protein [Rhodocyclaceae bacterium]
MTKPGTMDINANPLQAARPDDELRRQRARMEAEVATRQGVERRLSQVQAAYARFVPPQLLELLGKESILDVDWGNQAEKKMTILFSDIRGFASMSERMSPQQCFDFINAYLSFMEPVVLAHGGFIDKYIGDSVMALFPARGDDALAAAISMLAELNHFNAQRTQLLTKLPPDHPERRGASEVKIGIGMNSGLLMLGVIGGASRMEVTVISDAVNLASRVEALTKTYQTPILITQHTLNSIRHPADFSIRFIDRVRVRGKHLAQSIYEVFDADPAPLKAAKLASLDTFENALAHYHFRRMEDALTLFGDCLEHNPGDTPAAVYWQRCRQAHNIRGSVHPGEAGETDSATHWHPEYLLGLAGLDGMHQAIFGQIVALSEALQQDSPGAAGHLAGKLVEWTAEHFATEELLMQAHDYPHSPFAEHRQQHEKFREFLDIFAAEIHHGKTSSLRLAFRCQFLLLDWFVSHINITDRHLERYLAGRITSDTTD